MLDKVESYLSLIDAESADEGKLDTIVDNAAFDSELTDDEFYAIQVYAEIVKEFRNGT